MGQVTSKFNVPDMIEFLNRHTLDGRHVELSGMAMMFLMALDRKAFLTYVFKQIRELKRQYPLPKRRTK